MLTIKMTLLGDRYRASRFDDRRRAEWPPDPARLFYAAVDATHSASPVDPAEIDTLHWWESLGAPVITCSEATERAVVDHYVPGNYASSWSRDIQGHWQRLDDLNTELHAARASGDTHQADKLLRSLEKAASKLRTDTAQFSRTNGKESDKVAEEAARVLPEHRMKQARTFPTVSPAKPDVYFTWPAADGDNVRRESLNKILSRIARVGHSSSTVTCEVVDDEQPPTWVPTDSARPTLRLRTTDAGLLDALHQEYERHAGRLERVMPARLTGYVRAGEPVVHLPAQEELGDWIILKFHPRQQLPLWRTLDVCRSVRAAMMAHGPDPLPPLISGHGHGVQTDGLKAPHMSVLALPDVTHPRSDGYIQAVGLGLPADIGDTDRSAVTETLARWSRDGTNDGFTLLLPGGIARQLLPAEFHAAVAGPSGRVVASRQFWARTNNEWSSVTPVALDRHPRTGRDPDFDELSAAIAPIVSDMCIRVGLPRPVYVLASPVSTWSAVPPVKVGRSRDGRRSFPQYGVSGQHEKRRYTTHLTIRFDQEVQGPLILGAGRYFGYGLMRPSPGSREASP
jgi:CRISPR-associated protein Csb2